MKIFVFDAQKCNGCYNCQIVCKDEHCDADWRPYAAPQPESGQFWLKVNEKIRGKVPWVRAAYIPVMCQHCEDAPCLKVAQNDAVYRREDGLIIIDPAKAHGQRAIADACPIHAIFWNDELEIPQKCTGCAHLIDNGWTVPRCVDACATEALRFGEYEDFADELRDAEFLPEVSEFTPHVYYLNMPKRFIAGSVIDKAADEVIINAEVNLVVDDEIVATLKTDDLGDFKFDQIAKADYKIVISAEGFDTLEIPANTIEDDVVLGDILLTV